MRMRSAGGRSPCRPHGSMYTTIRSPFQRKADCLYQVNASSIALPPDDAVPKDPDSFDLHLYRIAGAEELRRRPREPDAGRRPGDDDVTWPQLAAGRDLGDETRDLEDHVLRARVLLGHAVDAGPDGEIRGVELVRGHDPGTHGKVRVEVLALEP